jgi:regulator of sirC expression with transglutaminase-like and TPR domain
MDPSLAEAFRAFAAHPRSELDGALLVSRIVRPSTDIAWCHTALQRLADGVSAATPAGLIATLRDAGFSGATQYYEPDNSALDFVLRERRGIPISLAVVVLGVADQCGIPGLGINFPGHFLVTLDDQLIDPFTLTLIDDDDRRERLAQCGLPAAEALIPATPIDITLRMLNNLRGLAVARGDHAGAITLTDYQLIIAPNRFPIHLARVELWNALNATTMMQRELEQALTLAPSPAAKTELRKALQRITATSRPTLH